MTWRQTLPDMLKTGEYRTQAEIVAALERDGASVDQSSVSRELRRLGVRKRAGVYWIPEPETLGAPVYAVSVAVGGSLAVVKTDPAFAAVVAQAIDRAALPGILGTIAGDDTVFVALGTPEAASHLHRLAAVSTLARH